MTQAIDGKAGDPSKGAEMKAEVFLPENYTPAEDEPFMNER